jgi:hypothetical protein
MLSEASARGYVDQVVGDESQPILAESGVLPRKGNRRNLLSDRSLKERVEGRGDKIDMQDLVEPDQCAQ